MPPERHPADVRVPLTTLSWLQEGKLVFYDCGMMNELQPNVAAGFKEACFAVFGGGPFIDQIQLDAAGKRLVDALELMGVLAKGADRLSVEKLARYFIQTFKLVQQGKKNTAIKTTLGADLQAPTAEPLRYPPYTVPAARVVPTRSRWRSHGRSFYLPCMAHYYTPAIFVPQALTDQQVFRFPSTFTFIFRAFASVDGIGKGLDPKFDIPKAAQP